MGEYKPLKLRNHGGALRFRRVDRGKPKPPPRFHSATSGLNGHRSQLVAAPNGVVYAVGPYGTVRRTTMLPSDKDVMVLKRRKVQRKDCGHTVEAETAYLANRFPCTRCGEDMRDGRRQR